MSPENFQAGQTISGTGYRVDSIIGTGAAGTVYKCTELTLNRPVAVKVLNSWSESFPNLTAIKRMEREAKVLSQLVHKNIVRVYRIGFIEETLPFISMEYLDGISLRDYLTEKQSLSPRISLEIIKQAAEALAYAHKNGIVHRDLKPENIIVTRADAPSPEIKIIDFGLSKAISKSTTLTDPGDLIGTVLYMSPEQCSAKVLDARTDIYALGCIFYELITGEPPFQGNSVEEVLLKHLSEEAPKIQSGQKLLIEIQNIFQKCLQKRPEDRYQSAQDLIVELDKTLATAPDTVLDPARLKLSPQNKTQKSGKFIKISALALSLAALGIIASWLILPSMRVSAATLVARYMPPDLRFELQKSELKDLGRLSGSDIVTCLKASTQDALLQDLSFEQKSELLEAYHRLALNTDKDLVYELALIQLKNICRLVLQTKGGEASSRQRDIINASIDWFNGMDCSKSQWRTISSAIERSSSAFKAGGAPHLWRLSELRADALMGAHPGDVLHAEDACKHYIYAIQQALCHDENGAQRLERKVRTLGKQYSLNKALFRLSLALSLHYATINKLELLKSEFPGTLGLSENCALSEAEQSQLAAIQTLLDNPDKAQAIKQFQRFLQAW